MPDGIRSVVFLAAGGFGLSPIWSEKNGLMRFCPEFDTMLPHPGASVKFSVCSAGVGLSSRPSEGGLPYFSGPAFFCPVTPFFLSVALSAARWNLCPSRNGLSVTCAEGILLIPSASRNRTPSSPSSDTNRS